MKRIIKETGEKADDRLRRMCDGLSPRVRLIAVMASLTVFAAIAVYMAVSSVYGMDRKDVEIEHIRQVRFNPPGMYHDSINHLKIKNDDHDEQ